MQIRFLTVSVLLSLITLSVSAQRYSRLDNEVDFKSSIKVGTQIPFQHSLIYEYMVAPGFAINAGVGVVGYKNFVLSNLENNDLIDANDRRIIDRSYKSGITYQIGANIHFSKNYVRAFGQLVNLRGEMAITDLASLYLNLNIPLIQLLDPIEIRSNVTMAGLLYGRRFTFANPRHEIHGELSVGRVVGHNNKYETGTFIDNIGIVNDVVYSELNRDLNEFFDRYGWVPTINIFYVYKF